MKKIRKIKRLVTDKKAVSAVIGTVLMLSITIAVSSGVAVGIVKFGQSGRNLLDAQADILDAQVNMTKAQVGVIERFTDYLDTLGFKMPCDNTTGTCFPDIEYEWNDSTDDWDIHIIWGEAKKHIPIYPPYFDSEEGGPIFPPPDSSPDDDDPPDGSPDGDDPLGGIN